MNAIVMWVFFRKCYNKETVCIKFWWAPFLTASKVHRIRIPRVGAQESACLNSPGDSHWQLWYRGSASWTGSRNFPRVPNAYRCKYLFYWFYVLHFALFYNDYLYFIFDNLYKRVQREFERESHWRAYDVCDMPRAALGDLYIFSPLNLQWYVQDGAWHVEGLCDS